jgi:PKD repeat protein
MPLILLLGAASPLLGQIPSTQPAASRPTTRSLTTRPATTEPWRPSTNHPKLIRILLSPGVAPCVVHVNALEFPLAHGTPLTARYNWNFGDPAGRFNALPGFNAAHVYDVPGQYTITLSVTDEAGTVDSASSAIVISPDRRRVIFVAPEGSDANTGMMADRPLHSLGAALALKKLPDNFEILLRAGGIYYADTTLKIGHSNALIGRYDDGPDPVLMLSKKDGPKPPHGFISIDGRCNGVTIEHITFDSPYAVTEAQEAPKIGIDAIVARGRNITVRNCTFLNVDSAINANGSPMGLMVMDCKAPLKTGLRAYLVWTQGSDFVCLGNVAANSTREHIVRLSGVSKALIAANDFTNLDRRPADKYDTSKGTIEMHNGSYAYIAHNTVADGTIRVGPLGINDEPVTTATDWSVIESNTLSNTFLVAYSGAHHVMMRNNIIRNDSSPAIVLQAPDDDGRVNSDIRILNNTAIDTGTTGGFMKVWGHVDGIELKNNLLIAPNLKVGVNGAAVINLAEGNLSSFTAIGHNLWPVYGGGEQGVEFMANKQTLTLANWLSFAQVRADATGSVTLDDKNAPPIGSPADGQGEPLAAVCFDQRGHPRPAHPTVGAVEASIRPATLPAAEKSQPAN